MKRKIRIEDMAKADGQLVTLEPSDLMPLPPPYDEPRPLEELSAEQRQRYEASLDGILGVAIPKPARAEGRRGVRSEVPVRPQEAAVKREQLDVPAAPRSLPQLLRQVPALQRFMSRIRGKRQTGDIPPDVSSGGAPPHHQQVSEKRECEYLQS